MPISKAAGSGSCMPVYNALTSKVINRAHLSASGTNRGMRATRCMQSLHEHSTKIPFVSAQRPPMRRASRAPHTSVSEGSHVEALLKLFTVGSPGTYTCQASTLYQFGVYHPEIICELTSSSEHISFANARLGKQASAAVSLLLHRRRRAFEECDIQLGCL